VDEEHQPTPASFDGARALPLNRQPFQIRVHLTCQTVCEQTIQPICGRWSSPSRHQALQEPGACKSGLAHDNETCAAERLFCGIF
jgi:hypothetical protein